MSPNATLLVGDCLERLRELPPDSLDSLVTDPPAGIAFMGKDWDKDKGGRDEWVSWMTDVMRECLRVLKPGAHGLVWALPRTSGWTHRALEDAGFEVRDCISHLFGVGFPKSKSMREIGRPELGTALKPAHEVWWLIRKPLGEKTVAANVLKHGTGALNIDASRVAGHNPSLDRRETARRTGNTPGRPGEYGETITDRISPEAYVADRAGEHLGRFPANLVLSHSEGCKLVGTKGIKATAPRGKPSNGGANNGDKYGAGKTNGGVQHHDNGDGTETVEAWECADDCAVRALDEQSGNRSAGRFPGKQSRHAASSFSVANGRIAPEREMDSGGASRFFYCAKASRKDRNSGCEDLLTWEGQDLGSLTEDISQLARGISADAMASVVTAWSTESCGSSTTARFLPAIRFTIETVTRLITELKTSNSSRLLSTSESIQAATRTIAENGSSPAEAAAFINSQTSTTTDAETASLLRAAHALLLALNEITKRAKRGNVHSTVKSTALMRYLLRLVTPPGGTVLDPFAGSGSTGVAALREGFRFVGIEREAEYAEIAASRLRKGSA
jgi:DNA modification methylase